MVKFWPLPGISNLILYWKDNLPASQTDTSFITRASTCFAQMRCKWNVIDLRNHVRRSRESTQISAFRRFEMLLFTSTDSSKAPCVPDFWTTVSLRCYASHQDTHLWRKDIWNHSQYVEHVSGIQQYWDDAKCGPCSSFWNASKRKLKSKPFFKHLEAVVQTKRNIPLGCRRVVNTSIFWSFEPNIKPQRGIVWSLSDYAAIILEMESSLVHPAVCQCRLRIETELYFPGRDRN